jgi:DNA-cytosine methyltransferase
MNDTFTVLSLFDGISCGLVALKRAGIKIKAYYASEIDKDSISVARNNHPEIIHIGDVTKVSYINGVLTTENGIYDVGKVDLLIGGSPCQSFSFQGKQLGFDDTRGMLFFEYVRLRKETNADYFLFENVPMNKTSSDVISEQLNIEYIKINSSLVSAQKRLRLYWTNIPGITQPEDKNIYLKDIAINSSKVNGYKSTTGLVFSGITSYIEMERLQTLPDNYTISARKGIRHKILVNGWTIDVIVHILNNLK